MDDPKAVLLLHCWLAVLFEIENVIYFLNDFIYISQTNTSKKVDLKLFVKKKKWKKFATDSNAVTKLTT